MNALLVDGSAMAYRAYFAFERNPLRTSRGEPTSVPFAFLTTLLRWMRRYEPRVAAVVFDAPGETHRHRLDRDYKANRPPRPEGLKEQMPRLREALAALRLPVLEVPGWEADDVLATLARQLESRGESVFLASGDKDFRQIVSSAVRLVRPAIGGGEDVEIGPAELRRDLGLGPESIVDLMALVGDAVDNVPGIEGVGEKTAAELVQRHGGLEALFANLEAVHRPVLRRKLEIGREQAFRARELVRLRTDAPVDATRAMPVWEGPEWPVLRGLLRELEFVQLLRALPPETAAASTALELRAVRGPDQLAALGAELLKADTIALHVETRGDAPAEEIAFLGLARRAAEAIGFGIRLAPAQQAPRPGELDLRMPAGVGFELEALRTGLGAVLADPAIAKLGADLKHAIALLERHGLPVAGRLFDVSLASYVLHSERRRHDLEALVLEHLEERLGAGPAAEPEAAAARSAASILRLGADLEPRLRAEPELERLFERVEMPLVRVLRDMETAGVRVDVAALGALSRELESRIQELATTVQRLAGRSFNLHSTQQIGQVLFSELRLPHGRRTRTGWSTDSDVLEALAPEHEIVRGLLEHRQLTKLRSTYCEALPRLADPHTGRIHTTFHQTVASTGRLSSSDPNLQNIPIRTDLGRRIRAAFVAGEADGMLLSADYSQIELRLLAHLSKDAALRAALDGGDVHARTAARIAGCKPEEVTSAMRAAAKAVNFGVVYGMGARGLADRLGISQEEARRFIDEYFAGFPAVKSFCGALVQRARDSGYATTILGRRLALPELQSPQPARRAAAERVAVNAPIQGSAADLIKLAMVGVHERLGAARLRARLVLQVHDELVLDVPAAEVDVVRDLVRDAMQTALPLEVPIVVDVGVGPSWAAAH